MDDFLSPEVDRLVDEATRNCKVQLAPMASLYQGVVHGPGLPDVAPETTLVPSQDPPQAASRESSKREREAEDDETPTLIKKVRADAPLLAHMESIQELKSEFLDGIDDIMGYMASCIYKRSNQPLDTDMYKKCFERLSCTRAFLENCYD